MFTKNPLQYLYNTKNQYDIAMKLNHRVINTLPKLKKIIITLNSPNLNSNYLEDYLGILELLTMQKPLILRSKKPVINLKIRKNQIVGFKVTLRKYLMFQFLLKFFALITPRYPFFQGYRFGYNKGSISFAYKRLSFFHELETDPEYANNTLFPPLNITLHTTSSSKYEAFALLRNLQIPCLTLK